MSNQQFDEFDQAANRIMSKAIDDLTDKLESEEKARGELDDRIMNAISSGACMKFSRDLLKSYHEELMKYLRSKGL